MTKQVFGTLPDGTEVLQVTIRNRSGLEVDVITYGGIIRCIRVPDKHGVSADVLLGKSTLDGYLRGAAGAAVIGRFANRIEGAGYTLDGKEVKLEANEGSNTLHGASGNYGIHNFALVGATDRMVRLALHDSGEGGFPGEASVEVVYEVADDGTLTVEYTVIPTETGPVNITNHAYFNLAGEASGPIDDQVLRFDADFYTPASRTDIPTGEIRPVDGGPFDFRAGKKMADAFRELEASGDWHNGYDHNLVLRGRGYREVAEAYDPKSGRTLTLLTDLPGVQFFTGNFFSRAGMTGKKDVPYPDHAGFCLETQYFPDTINKPHFPCCIVKAGEVFKTRTGFRFGVR